jgi:hypothetical protein
MKTQVIQLDAHDDVVSVRDRLGWGRASRIILHWPERGKILQRQLDLVLLKRYAQRNGAQIGIVTRDEVVLEHAREVEIPVFRDIVHAQQGRWRVGRRRQRLAFKKGQKTSPAQPASPPLDHSTSQAQLLPPPNLTWWRVGLFTVSLLAITAIVFSLLPGATITLRQPQNEQILDVTLVAAEEPAAGQFDLKITTIVVEGRSSAPTTGKVTLPEKTAVGSVRFTNLTDQVVLVPKGTIVTTLSEPVVRFATNRDARLAAGYGRSTLVEVTAVDPGAQGNLPADQLQAIEGTLGLSLTVRNISPTRGGKDQEVNGPSQADRKKLLDRLIVELESQARKEIMSRWQSSPLTNDFPITPTLTLDEILEKTYLPELDWPSNELSLTLRVSFSAQAVAGEQLAEYFQAVLDSQLEFGQEPLSGEIGMRLTHPLEPYRNAQGTSSSAWQWGIQASRTIRKIILPNDVSQHSRLLPADQASLILQNALGMQEAPLVKTWPDWWPFLPITPLRIEVVIKP